MKRAMVEAVEDGERAGEEVVDDLVEQLTERLPSMKNVKMIQTVLLNTLVNRTQVLKG